MRTLESSTKSRGRGGALGGGRGARGGRGAGRGGRGGEGRVRDTEAAASKPKRSSSKPNDKVSTRKGKREEKAGDEDTTLPVAKSEDKKKKQRHDNRFAHRHTDATFSKIALPEAENRVDTASRDRIKSLKNRAAFRKAKVDRYGRSLRDEDDDEEEEEEGEEEEEIEEEDAATDDEDAIDWQQEDIEETDATKRIAIVNCDWDHIRAVDLYAVMSHCLPIGGSVKAVTVYLSDFGKEQIEREKIHGPDLWVRKGDEGYDAAKMEAAARKANNEQVQQQAIENDPDFDVADAESSDHEEVDPYDEEGNDGELFSSGKFRQYELNRMKYYYAVAEFDSVETAMEVYNKCDGVDIEASGVCLDLRYVEDEDTFDESRVHARATKIPPNFRAAKAFKSAALSQSKFRISWDQDDAYRRQDMRDLNDKDTDEANLMAYLASDSDDYDDDTEETDAEKQIAKRKSRKQAQRAEIRKKYAALLSDVGGIDPDALPAEDEDDEEQSDSDDIPLEGEDDDDDSSGDDDDLNRLSDVSLDDEEEEEEEEEDEEDEDDDDDDELPTGDMEASFDLDADTKAEQLQNLVKKKQSAVDADLGARNEAKYRAQRKDAKKTKKAMLRMEREDESALPPSMDKDALKRTFGEDAEERAAPRRGREYQKQLAKEARAKAAEERGKLKKQRIIQAHTGLAGGDAAAKISAQPQQPAEVASALGRFGDRLMNNPKFHMDISSDRHRGKKDVAVLAQAVAAEKKTQGRNRPTAQQQKGAASKTVDDSATTSAVEHFLKKAGKKRPREE